MSSSYIRALPFQHATRVPAQWLRDLAFAALWLLVFTIPWEDTFFMEGFGTFSRAVGITAFALALLAVGASGQLRMVQPVHLAMLAFVLWGGISSLWTIDRDNTLLIAGSYIQLLAMVWLIWEFAPGPTRQRHLLQAYVLGTYVSALGTILNYATGSTTYWEERYVAGRFDPNDLCVILALSIPMSFYLTIIEPRGVCAWLWRIHPAPVLFAAFLTASRGGFLAICTALLVVPFLFGKLPTATKLLFPILAGLLFIAVTVWSPPAVFQRLSSIPSEVRGMTFGERGEIWKAGWEVFRQHPVRGVGVAAFATAVEPVLGGAGLSHNTAVQLLVETGLVGLSLFLTAAWLLVEAVVRLKSLERCVWSVLMATWMCGAMSLSWAHRKPTWFLFGLLVVQAAGMARRRSGRQASAHAD